MERNTQLPNPGKAAPFPDYFWAKTTDDNQPGISVGVHRLNVGCEMADP